MNVTVETVSAVTRKLVVTIPGERVKRELDTAYNNLQKEARMHGFRPGKVPRSVLEGRFRQNVEGEVMSRLVNDSLSNAIEQNQLIVVSQPSIEPGRLVPGVDFQYTAEVEVKPAVEAKDYLGLKLTREKYPNDEEALDQRLKALLDSKADMVALEEARPLAKGDIAHLDYSAYCEGRPLEKNMPRTVHVPLDESAFLPGFTDQVVGMNAGETRQFELDVPADFTNKGLAGKTVSWTIALHDIKKKVLPELNDEFAQDMEAENVEGLKENLRKEIAENLNQIAEIKRHRQAAELLIGNNPIELPSGLINQQIDLLAQERRRQAGQKPVKGKINLTEAERAALAVEASFRLRTSLILENIAKVEALSISDADVQQRLQDIADETGQRVEQVKGMYIKNNAMDDLKSKLLEEKALEFVIEKADITDEDHPLTDARL
ncbi:MAG: trigger factor [Myxococcota bacterium]